MSEGERLTRLELELMAERDLVETLNAELTSANGRIDVLEKRVDRLERQIETLLHALEVPANEKPPHY